ncbi:MAG: tetratricopeptide repeat protein [Gemmataceae bacterium]
MRNIEETYRTALGHQHSGQLALAEQLYRQILQSKPSQTDVWYQLGTLFCQKGQFADGARCFQETIRLGRRDFRLYGNLGAVYAMLGQPEEAVLWHRRALELNPNYAEGHINLGNALGRQGKIEEAAACYRRGLELSSLNSRNESIALLNLGHALRNLGQLQEAAASYRRFVELNPKSAEGHSSLGSVFLKQGKAEEAAASYRTVLELSPNEPEAHNNLGVALMDQEQTEEALKCFQHACRLQPDYPEALNNLGNAHRHQGNYEEAIATFHRVLASHPNHVRAYNNLGAALLALHRYDEACVCLRRAQELQPDWPETYLDLGNGFKAQGLGQEAIGCYRRALELAPNYHEVTSPMLFALWSTPGFDLAAIAEEHRRWEQRYVVPLHKKNGAYPNERSPEKRLRVGYVSPDFREHVVGRNVLPLLREHDREQVEVVCYSNGNKPDSLTVRFQEIADLWRNIRGVSDERVAELVREDQIDILVDLALHTAGNRLLTFASKPAPVQVTFAGYPGTTGMTAIDYRLTDPYLDPPGEDESHYAEKTIRLPHSYWCYEPNGDEPEVGPLPALERGKITFGCLNNPSKINAGVIRAWSRVLRGVPESELLVLCNSESQRQRMLDVLKNEGVEKSRLRTTGRVPRKEYLALYNQIDIGLDTLPYNGHTTSLEGFWMGVPLVSQRGSTLVGRAGLGHLTNLGLAELVGQNEDEFVRIAIGLATDLPRLQDLRVGMRERMKASPLMDVVGFTRGIEAAYREMWKRWCESELRVEG